MVGRKIQAAENMILEQNIIFCGAKLLFEQKYRNNWQNVLQEEIYHCLTGYIQSFIREGHPVTIFVNIKCTFASY